VPVGRPAEKQVEPLYVLYTITSTMTIEKRFLPKAQLQCDAWYACGGKHAAQALTSSCYHNHHNRLQVPSRLQGRTPGHLRTQAAGGLRSLDWQEVSLGMVMVF
jgi:hypothetical protein